MAKFDKRKLPSRHTSFGPEKAPHRSFYYAMNLTRKDVAKPFVGVVSTWNEAAPCNIALMRQAQSVKKGVKDASGTPREFCTITVTDGIAMGHEGMKSSLISREVIADSAELTVRRLVHNSYRIHINICNNLFSVCPHHNLTTIVIRPKHVVTASVWANVSGVQMMT